MNQAILQIQYILVYLAVALIPTTFAIYAICCTYQRQEKGETEKELKKRESSIKSSIDKITEKLKRDSCFNLFRLLYW